MYESPIEVVYGDMHHKIDNEIYAAIVNVGVNVDKDELVRALSYDRQQYEKGYEDGKKAFAKELMSDLDGDMGTYRSAGYILKDVYGWLGCYLRSKGLIDASGESIWD